VSTIIYGNQEAKVKDTSIIYTAEVGWFEPVANELGKGHEKDDTKNFERHIIKFEIYNHLLCTGFTSFVELHREALAKCCLFLPYPPLPQ
jgi:hypothetical protein